MVICTLNYNPEISPLDVTYTSQFYTTKPHKIWEKENHFEILFWKAVVF